MGKKKDKDKSKSEPKYNPKIQFRVFVVEGSTITTITSRPTGRKYGVTSQPDGSVIVPICKADEDFFKWKAERNKGYIQAESLEGKPKKKLTETLREVVGLEPKEITKDEIDIDKMDLDELNVIAKKIQLPPGTIRQDMINKLRKLGYGKKFV